MGWGVHPGIEGVLAGLVALVVLDGVVGSLHEQEEHDLEVGFLAGEVQGGVA